MALTVRVYDPTKGEEIAVTVTRKPDGTLYLQELPAHNFAGSETPRLLEKKAAFIDIASRTFGQAWTRDGAAVWMRLKEEMPLATRSFVNKRRSQREERQKHLRDLVGSEVIRNYVQSDSRRWRFYRKERGETGGAATAPSDPVAALLRDPHRSAVFPLAARARSPAGKYASSPPRPDEQSLPE